MRQPWGNLYSATLGILRPFTWEPWGNLYNATLGTLGTLGTLETLGTLGTLGTLELLGTLGTLGILQTLGTSGTLGTLGTSGALGTLGTLGEWVLELLRSAPKPLLWLKTPKLLLSGNKKIGWRAHKKWFRWDVHLVYLESWFPNWPPSSFLQCTQSLCLHIASVDWPGSLITTPICSSASLAYSSRTCSRNGHGVTLKIHENSPPERHRESGFIWFIRSPWHLTSSDIISMSPKQGSINPSPNIPKTEATWPAQIRWPVHLGVWRLPPLEPSDIDTSRSCDGGSVFISGYRFGIWRLSYGSEKKMFACFVFLGASFVQ